MKGNIYVLAGHEGKGTGASSPWMDEGQETRNLQELICYALQHKYGVTPLTEPERQPLPDTIDWLRGVVTPDDIVLDLHFNAYKNGNAKGTEVLYPTTHSKLEVEQATLLLNLTVSILGTYPRGVFNETRSPHQRLGILNGPERATNLLLEVCFCTCEGDVEKYNMNRTYLADGIAQFLYDHVSRG